METFADYAAWYDAFNKQKDYAAEAAYILERVRPWSPAPRSWLDIGCGTGNHLALLAATGISVAGVDSSPSMIAQARHAHPGMAFHVGRAQDFDVPGRWDVISMLFHVMSYQSTDDDVRKAMSNVAAHLGEGVFAFDFWHTGGVLHDPPGFRTRETTVGDRRLFRLSRPVEDRKRRLVDVRYEFRWDRVDGEVAHEERHMMRHFEVDELRAFLDEAGLTVVECTGWMRDASPGAVDWYGMMFARKRGVV